MEISPKFKELPVYQKIRYVAELIAIVGGLIILILNYWQMSLLNESNRIARNIYESTFSLEVGLKLVQYSDNMPISMKFQIENIGTNPFEISANSAPRYILANSEEVKFGEEIEVNLYEEKESKSKPVNFSELNNKIFLNPKGKAIFAVKVYFKIENFLKANDTFLYRPEFSSFVLIPLHLIGLGHLSGDKFISIALLRDRENDLRIDSEVKEGQIDKLIHEKDGIFYMLNKRYLIGPNDLLNYKDNVPLF